jgi:hypothetical protein
MGSGKKTSYRTRAVGTVEMEFARNILALNPLAVRAVPRLARRIQRYGDWRVQQARDAALRTLELIP